jgi:hypothetical protein
VSLAVQISALAHSGTGYPYGRNSGDIAAANHTHVNAAQSVTPLVARGIGPEAYRVKNVRVFELIPLNSAPGRIRTCAHGSGGGCCARP